MKTSRLVFLVSLLAAVNACSSGGSPPAPRPQDHMPKHPHFKYSSNLKAEMSSLGECGHSKYWNTKGTPVPPHNELRLLRGRAAAGHEFPFQASIVIGPSTCAGAIISSRWVLTSARCFDDLNLAKCQQEIEGQRRCHVIVGANVAWGHARDGELMNIHMWFLPEAYVSGIDQGDFDIALVLLEKEISLASWNVQPICLPKSCERPCTDPYYVVGWGDSKLGRKGYEELLQVGQANLNNDFHVAQCKYGTRICVGSTEGVGLCREDSGGPLICLNEGYFRLDGILSWTAKGCGGGVYTKVCQHLKWIRQVSSNYVTSAWNKDQQPGSHVIHSRSRYAAGSNGHSPHANGISHPRRFRNKARNNRYIHHRFGH